MSAGDPSAAAGPVRASGQRLERKLPGEELCFWVTQEGGDLETQSDFPDSCVRVPGTLGLRGNRGERGTPLKL
ncbi:hypothetical protein DPEC_G00344280 [Dallia pectoralis]|uniref:Uncharacterized protein n=1 Tax=Dallia pectoralis TaxID=75939 RepID=A0ACC2F3C8_DALPE|nr:hypothetical protein DPEC_G00344280 [Dallia pectoralis]